MRSDSTDVNSLVSYIKDVKPFHSKLTEVTVEYQANDDLKVKIEDSSRFDMLFSSAWELEFVSDGRRKQYRIPAAVFPRYSNEFHQSIFEGIAHELPGAPWVYPVPANNGIKSVSVDGQLKELGLDYEILENGTRIKFKRFRPALKSVVEIIWAVCDRVFVAIGYDEYDYVSAEDGLDMLPFDASLFDSEKSSWIVPRWKEYSIVFSKDFSTGIVLTSVEHKPIGFVRTVLDEFDRPFYVFEFNSIIPLDTRIWIRVEQREAYNGWTQTSFTESLLVQDSVYYTDTINAWIADPETWRDLGSKSRMDRPAYTVAEWNALTDAHEFGINISADDTYRRFDTRPFDTELFDSKNAETFKLGYYQLFSIEENIKDNIKTVFSEIRKEDLQDFRKDLFTSTVGEKIYSDLGLLPKTEVKTIVMDVPPGAFDVLGYDEGTFDSVTTNPPLLSVSKSNIPNRTSNDDSDVGVALFRESLSMQINRITYFDEQGYENAPFDASADMSISSYEPDENGMVYTTEPTNFMEIRHSMPYLPMVEVYVEVGNSIKMVYPSSVSYPAENIVLVKMTSPQKLSVRVF